MLATVSCLFIAVQTTLAVVYVPDMTETYFERSGYVLKTGWEHFQTNLGDISVSVADFDVTEDPNKPENQKCVRLAVLTGKGAPLDVFKVSCRSPYTFLGVKATASFFWYFSTTVREVAYKKENFEYLRYVTMNPNSDEHTCVKTWWVVLKLEGKTPKTLGLSTEEVTIDQDEDCKYVQTACFIITPDPDVTGLGTGVLKFNLSFIPGDIGGKLTQFIDGPNCVQLLQLTHRNRVIDAVKVSCALPVLFILNNTLYVSNTIMVRPLEFQDTFLVVYSPSAGRSYPNRLSSPKPTCIKRTFKLVNTNDSYISKKMLTIKEFYMSPECEELRVARPSHD